METVWNGKPVTRECDRFLHLSDLGLGPRRECVRRELRHALDHQSVHGYAFGVEVEEDLERLMHDEQAYRQDASMISAG